MSEGEVQAGGLKGLLESFPSKSTKDWSWWAFKKVGGLVWIASQVGIIVVFPILYSTEMESAENQQLLTQGYSQQQIEALNRGEPLGPPQGVPQPGMGAMR